MRARPLAVPGAFAFDSNACRDVRGELQEFFREDVFRAATGRTFRLAQANTVVSRLGALRGISVATAGHAKYLTCTDGAVLDALVDLRTGSAAFGSWHLERLDAERRTSLFVPPGVGHATLALADRSSVTYLLSELHRPEKFLTIDPLDADLAIEWPPEPASVVVGNSLSLVEALDRNLLPAYSA
ncbi:dTDP-4-dehydrorhamnose 3,5-epimerase family protein [Kitasatospora sp. NPDC058184]|uniref:dTDP-4-dehydrorhamnose 3,5-epimerase family protein n=1 Tax=Kitasatospora sp. NPDC058184 TaxID=3346370 RepID=UPI0036D8E216